MPVYAGDETRQPELTAVRKHVSNGVKDESSSVYRRISSLAENF